MTRIRETLHDDAQSGTSCDLPSGDPARQLSAAADLLGISQPAVSLQIRQLEQFLQTRLVERTGRGIKATPAGQALLLHEERIQQAVDEAVRSVSEFSHDVSGTVTLGTGATACIHLLPPLLQQLRSDYPLLKVG